MPYDLELAKNLKKGGWKVKIHDFERLEEPHATIYFKSAKWRLSLRSGEFLDLGDKWSQISEAVRKTIQGKKNWDDLCAAWDTIHPDNPVNGGDDDDPE